MALHTTFKIGGPAKLMAFPKSEEEISEVIKECNGQGVRYLTVGNGSNLLVSDDGIDAVVILLGKEFGEVKLLDDTTIFAEAGAPLMKVCRFALENGLTGLEFAYGIPGSCGGGAFMNAGAYGGEMKDVLVSVRAVSPDGRTVREFSAEELQLGYRRSILAENGYIVTEAVLQLAPGNREEIAGKMKELTEQRNRKQPVQYPSAGSTFKRPEGYFAGKLIEDAGLRGYRVGDARCRKSTVAL